MHCSRTKITFRVISLRGKDWQEWQSIAYKIVMQFYILIALLGAGGPWEKVSLLLSSVFDSLLFHQFQHCTLAHGIKLLF